MPVFCMAGLENAILLYNGVTKLDFLYGGSENAISLYGGFSFV